MPSFLQTYNYKTNLFTWCPKKHKPLLLTSKECGCDNVPVTGRILPQALHNVLHIVGVDVVSLQQAVITGALHGKLQNTKSGQVFVSPGGHA